MRYESTDQAKDALFPQTMPEPQEAYLKATVPDALKNTKERCAALIGPSGTGKTWACWGLINAYRQRGITDPQVWMLKEYDFMDYMWDNYAIDAIKRWPRKLIIDDLGYRCHGEQRPHEWLSHCAYVISDYRTAGCLKTIWTSNLTRERLTVAYGPAVASRIFAGLVVETEGKDLRQS